jgi:hypothetical protein
MIYAIMNTRTALVIFTILAVFGLVTATLAVPIVPQAHAQGRQGGPPPFAIEKACGASGDRAFGGTVRCP